MLKIKILHISLLIFLGYSILSCTKSDESYTVDNSLVSIKSSMITIDTSTLNTYTFKLDSTVTSGNSKAIVGRVTDGEFGTITATSFFQLGIAENSSLSSLATASKPRYDSIALIMKPTGYCYGDSTIPWTIQAHQLTENLVDNEISYRYNVAKLNYNSTSLGTRTFKKKPESGKKVYIRLSDTFGEELYNIIKTKGSEVDDQISFNKYFKGLALTPDESQTNSTAIFRFDLADSVTYIRLYYHVGEDDRTIDFKLLNETKQFNRIISDYGSSKLGTLTKQRQKIPSSQTNNESYCQAGTGVMTRIEFPYLRNLFETYKYYKIMQAYLYVRPVKKTYLKYDLPSKIYLYYLDDLNNILGSVKTSSASDAQEVTPALNKDLLYNENTFYRFDITYYMNYIINNLTDSPPAIAISLPTDEMGYSTERLIIGNRWHTSNNINLEVTFWKY